VTGLRCRQDGSVLILTVGFVVVLMLFVGVVTDASKLFVTRRALAAVADGAATTAAQQVDLAAVYRGWSGSWLPLSGSKAATAAERSVHDAAAGSGLVNVRLDSVAVIGPDVVVTVSGRAVLPLASLVTGSPEGVVVVVTAQARSAVAR